MGLDQVVLDPSLRSLTQALGLDDDSVEEVISSRLSQSGETLSSGSIPFSRSHLSCLQYCQVTGSSTCSASNLALNRAFDKGDASSIASSKSNLHSGSELRSRSVYLSETTRSKAENRSSCSLQRTASKASTLASRFRRKCQQRSDGLKSEIWPHNAAGNVILQNPAHAAISESKKGGFYWTQKLICSCKLQDAGLSGMPFSDLTFVCKADGLETHAHSFALSATCPMLLQRIQADGTLDLDVEIQRQSTVSISSQLTSSKKCSRKWGKPQRWFGSKKGAKSLKDEVHHESNLNAGSIASISSQSSKGLPNSRSVELTSSLRPRRIQVTGCNGPDLRAFIFYLYTDQFRMVSSHSIEGVDDTEAFRGITKASSSQTASDFDEKAWDPLRIRNSRSLHSIIFPGGKERGPLKRRLSSHSILSLGFNAHHSKTPSIYTLGPDTLNEDDDTTLQEDPSLAPPFSVQGAYHLSQIFNLSRLAFASLSYYKHQLTLTNALQYYISPFSIAYPSIQSACLEYLVKNWSQVSAQSQTQTILGRLAAGWYPQANMALLELLGKVD